MANYVSSTLTFNAISKEGEKVVQETIDNMRSRSGSQFEIPLGYAFVENLESADSKFMCENVGAKWAYMNDGDTDFMTFESAWSPPTEFVEHLIEKVALVDENVVACFRYEDEMPNFIGAEVYTSEGLYDAEEIEWEEILEKIFVSEPELKEEYDDETGFSEKGDDILSEVKYELMQEWQNDTLNLMMRFGY